MTLRPHISNSAAVPSSRAPATGSALHDARPEGPNFALRTPHSEFRVSNTPHSALRTPHLFAFTLIELLVVIGIIGALMAIGLPAMRGMTRSNAIVAANRQFIDDLSYARQNAIANHTTVYVVFVPTNIATAAFTPPKTPKGLYRQYTNLYTGQYSTYALVSLRQLGEQPGRSTPKYLTDWRTLPNGVFITPAKFAAVAANKPFDGPGFYYMPSSVLPFPVATNFPPGGLQLPCLVFNYLGQLIDPTPSFDSLLPYGTPTQDQYIPFARGSVFFDPVTFAADIQENPAGNSIGSSSNVVYINALTGRAKILQQQVQ